MLVSEARDETGGRKEGKPRSNKRRVSLKGLNKRQ